MGNKLFSSYSFKPFECVSNVFFSPISDVLSLPVLEIVADNDLIPANKMKLICHLQYNARAPAPPINYYFYKNDNRLGTATSENHDLVRRTPGQYSCRAKVPLLGISRSSELESFEQVKGT